MGIKTTKSFSSLLLYPAPLPASCFFASYTNLFPLCVLLPLSPYPYPPPLLPSFISSLVPSPHTHSLLLMLLPPYCSLAIPPGPLELQERKPGERRKVLGYWQRSFPTLPESPTPAATLSAYLLTMRTINKLTHEQRANLKHLMQSKHGAYCPRMVKKLMIDIINPS